MREQVRRRSDRQGMWRKLAFKVRHRNGRMRGSIPLNECWRRALHGQSPVLCNGYKPFKIATGQFYVGLVQSSLVYRIMIRALI